MALTLSYPSGGALIVGGTGVVGEGLVRQMAAAGVPLIFTFRDKNGRNSLPRAMALEAELRQNRFSVRARKMDLSDEGSIYEAIDSVVESYGRLHTLFCASGPVTPFSRIADFTVEEVSQFCQQDQIAYFRLYRAAVHRMRGSGGGSITGTSTMANYRVLDFDGISSFSKASVEALTRQIAAEEASHNIRCNGVAIGWVSHNPLDRDMAQFGPRSAVPETREEMGDSLMWQIFDRMRLVRTAKITEVGSLFAFLASNEAQYITGQTIVFDGGITL